MDYDVIILGAGPAGLGCAVYAARYNIKIIVIGEIAGGMMTEAHQVDNYLGLPGLTGAQLAQKFIEHVKSFGVEVKSPEHVAAIIRSGKLFEVKTGSGMLKSKALLIAMGMKKSMLMVPGEEEFRGKGVSYCATCDGFFFRDRDVAVIGGGNMAVQSALALAGFCKKVHLVSPGKLSCDPEFSVKAAKTKNMEIHEKAKPMFIEGNEFVETLKVEKAGKSSNIKVSGVFIETGHVPSTELLKPLGIETNEKGAIKVSGSMATNVDGVFAAGDITTGSDGFRQIVTAVAEGAVAARSIMKFVRGQ